MKYQLIIFDFDGTLADTFPWFCGAIREAADFYGFKKINDHEADMLRGMDVPAIMKYLGVPFWKMPLLAARIRKMMSRDIEQFKLFAGAARMLQTLADHGLSLALVSSNSRRNVLQILGPRNHALFTYHESGVSVLGKHAKLEKIIRNSGVEPRRILAIGDELRDIEAAKRVKIGSGAVAWGYNNFEVLVAGGPDECFASMQDIVRCVTSQRGGVVT